jgi:hypothetical protein
MTNPINHSLDPYSPASILVSTTFAAATGGLTGALLSPIGIVGGALFGASLSLTFTLQSWCLEKANYTSDSFIGRIGIFALKVFGAVAATIGITSTMGFPVTILSGSALALATTAAGIGLTLSCIGCFSTALLVSFIALGAFYTTPSQ